MEEKNIKKGEEIIREFFKKMGLEEEPKITPPQRAEKTFFVKIEAEEPKILIGEQGKTLSLLQHLLKTILRRQIPEELYVDIDVNRYKEKKIRYLKELARSVANEVSLSKKEKMLDPMPAYERRIIHLELAERSDVTTESIGKEPDRRVVIKPYP